MGLGTCTSHGLVVVPAARLVVVPVVAVLGEQRHRAERRRLRVDETKRTECTRIDRQTPRADTHQSDDPADDWSPDTVGWAGAREPFRGAPTSLLRAAALHCDPQKHSRIAYNTRAGVAIDDAESGECQVTRDLPAFVGSVGAMATVTAAIERFPRCRSDDSGPGAAARRPRSRHRGARGAARRIQ
jgi:hypothetical protein